MLNWRESLNSNDYRILTKIFKNPPPKNLFWQNIQDLLNKLVKKLGGRIDPQSEIATIFIKLDSKNKVEIYIENLHGVLEPRYVTVIREVLEDVEVRP